MYENPQQRTALVVPVFEAVSSIQPFRAEHIPTAAVAIPPHVTIRSHFVPFEDIDGRLDNELVAFFGSRPRFRFTLERMGRFLEADVLYLDPEPEEPFQALMRSLNRTFPQAPPDPHPNRKMHVTIARCGVEGMDEMENRFLRECGSSLPIEAVAREVWLYEKLDGAWHKRKRFHLSEGIDTEGQ